MAFRLTRLVYCGRSTDSVVSDLAVLDGDVEHETSGWLELCAPDTKCFVDTWCLTNASLLRLRPGAARAALRMLLDVAIEYSIFTEE